jgi:hypothetical protein
MPAVERWRTYLERLPAATKVLVLFPPAHISTQPAAGSAESRRQGACKARIADLVRARGGGAVVDMRFPSAITAEDANYWDPLHYRLAVADRVTSILAEAAKGRNSDQAARLLP